MPAPNTTVVCLARYRITVRSGFIRAVADNWIGSRSALPGRRASSAIATASRWRGNRSSWSALGIRNSRARVGLSAPDGSFVVEVPDGNYHLRVATRLGNQCAVSSYESAASGWEAIVSVSGKGISGLVLAVEGTPSDGPALLGCSFLFEGLGRIQGTVTDPDGAPVAGVQVAASRYGEPRSDAPSFADGFDSDWTGVDGSFLLRLEPGPHLLHVRTSSRACTVAGRDDRTARGRAVFDAGDGVVRGIQIVVSGSASANRVWAVCGFPHSVTNELQPGWNLVGWVHAEAGIDALFESVPGLARAYAWDADQQRFLSTFRLGGRYVGSLTALTPGMGLRLYLAGRDSVTWTRDAVDEGLLRSKALRPGWNLVTWMGLDRVAFRAAVGDLGASLTAAASWDPETQRFVALDKTVDASAESRIVRRGEVFWVHSSTWRQWWQHGDSSDLVFLGEVPEARQSQIRELLVDTKAFSMPSSGWPLPTSRRTSRHLRPTWPAPFWARPALRCQQRLASREGETSSCCTARTTCHRSGRGSTSMSCSRT